MYFPTLNGLYQLRQTLVSPQDVPVSGILAAFSESAHDVGQHPLVLVLLEQRHQRGHQTVLIESRYVLRADGALPDAAGHRGQEPLVGAHLVALHELAERIQAACSTDHRPGLSVRGALEDGQGAILLQFHIVVPQVAHQLVDHPHPLERLSENVLQYSWKCNTNHQEIL